MLDGLSAAQGNDAAAEDLADTLKRLAHRWFVVRNVHAKSAPILLHPRHTISLMRGPMTRLEIRAARGIQDSTRGQVLAEVEAQALRE